jgi:hypothetical protein
MYCRQTSLQGAPLPPPPQTGPIYIVHHPGYVDDDDHFPQQHYAPRVTVNGMPWFVWLVIVLVISLGGSGAAFMRCTRGSTLVSSLVWSGSEPLVCSGNDHIDVSGVTAKFNAGTAIQASANCHVRCTNCTIEAATAIDASGNAEVNIIHGSIKGTPVLAEASNNAHVTIMGNVVAVGSTKQSGNAKVSAPTAKVAEPPPATPKAATPPAPAPAAPAPVTKPATKKK